ncbi:MAG: hypothetical protein AAF634_16285 [Bacteroidota bacterium]
MYKPKNKNRLRSGVQQHPFQWIKRKIALVIAAFMIGMSNAIFEEDKTIHGNQDKIEQREDTN